MLGMLGKVLNNVISVPAVREHPFLKNGAAYGVRDCVRINSENCNYCGACAKKCIANAITISKADNIITIDGLSCILCGLCEEECPKNCIKMV